MSRGVSMPLVDSASWQSTVRGLASARLQLLDDDLRSAQISFEDYETAKRVLWDDTSSRDESNGARARVFHHAKNFVLAMRRVGRLAADISANRAVFGVVPSPLLRQAWKKKESFFQRYVDPRNAIEHIDGELKGKTSLVLMNMENDTLCVTQQDRAEVNSGALQQAIALRDEIVAAVLAK